MTGILFLLLLLVPIAELWAIVQVADTIGVLETLALLVAMSLLGAWLLAKQGRLSWQRVRAATARGELPTREVADGVAIVIGGVLLLTPGFLTDVVGLLLLFPPTRAPLTRAVRRLLVRWARRRAEDIAAPVTTAAKVVRVTRRRTGEAKPQARLPRDAGDDADGSPGKE